MNDQEIRIAAARILGWAIVPFVNEVPSYPAYVETHHDHSWVQWTCDADGVVDQHDFDPLTSWSDAGMILTTMRVRAEGHPEEWRRFCDALDEGRVLLVAPEYAPRTITEAAVKAVGCEL